MFSDLRLQRSHLVHQRINRIKADITAAFAKPQQTRQEQSLTAAVLYFRYLGYPKVTEKDFDDSRVQLKGDGIVKYDLEWLNDLRVKHNMEPHVFLQPAVWVDFKLTHTPTEKETSGG